MASYNIEGYIIFAWIGGFVLFLINLILCLAIYPPKLEKDLIKRLNASCKPIILLLVLLQIPLIYIAANLGTPIVDAVTTYKAGEDASWNFGWGRPLAALCYLGLGGLFLTSGRLFRALALLGLAQDMVLTTYSAFDLDWWLSCLSSGKCVPTAGYNRTWYTNLRARDCGALCLQLWLLMLVLTISLAIGFVRVRYTRRELATGDDDRGQVMRHELFRFRLRRRKLGGHKAASEKGVAKDITDNNDDDKDDPHRALLWKKEKKSQSSSTEYLDNIEKGNNRGQGEEKEGGQQQQQQSLHWEDTDNNNNGDAVSIGTKKNTARSIRRRSNRIAASDDNSHCYHSPPDGGFGRSPSGHDEEKGLATTPATTPVTQRSSKGPTTSRMIKLQSIKNSKIVPTASRHQEENLEEDGPPSEEKKQTQEEE